MQIVNYGKTKKAQLKIQQMAFMLIAVTIFFALVGMFVLVFKFSELKESASLLEEKDAILLAEKLANSPEFSCGDSFGTHKLNCIDADKIMILKSRISRYSNFWGSSNIEIRKIYPGITGKVLCNSGNYPNCNIIRLISDEITGVDASTFVSLCRKELDTGSDLGFYNKCELAKLMVSYEQK
ncbi:MAG: hypothetical protein KKF48_04775 [Nanoarchaeota archaeon]|nr:hypothetical protein [Nanoarchaeota archaeon]MBU1028331.1 hypothetical protein [Nanoarchaeota archaeon]